MRSEEIEITYDALSTVVYGVFGLKLVKLRLFRRQVNGLVKFKKED